MAKEFVFQVSCLAVLPPEQQAVEQNFVCCSDKEFCIVTKGS